MSRHWKFCACIMALLLAIAVPSASVAAQGKESEKKDGNTEARRLVLKGLSRYLAGNYDEAIEYYTKALDIDPSYARGYDFRGTAYVKKGDDDKALADFSKVISRYPEYPDYVDVYNNRGNIFLRKKQYDRAIADFTKAIALRSDYAVAYYGRSKASLAKGDKAAHAEDQKKACAFNYRKACEELAPEKK